MLAFYTCTRNQPPDLFHISLGSAAVGEFETSAEALDYESYRQVAVANVEDRESCPRIASLRAEARGRCTPVQPKLRQARHRLSKLRHSSFDPRGGCQTWKQHVES